MFSKFRIQAVIFILLFTITAAAETLFQIKDELGNPVLVVSTDGLRILSGSDTLMVISSSEIRANIKEDATKALSRTFSVSTTSAKGSQGNIMNVTTDGMRIYDQTDESKMLGDTLMTISSKAIKAHIKGGGKVLSRTFSVSTTSAKGAANALEVGTDYTTMSDGVGKYTDFSPDNIFLGLNAGKSITDGKYNLFFGNQAGYNTRGDFMIQDPEYGHYNVFLGHESGYSNTQGKRNIYIGYRTGYTGTEANRNIFIGDLSGTNSTSNQNTFVGNEAGIGNSTGYGNSLFGCYAGNSNQTGERNTFIGHSSGYFALSGNNNTYVGSSSGESRPGGSRNTFVGSYAGSALYATTNDNLFVGYSSGYGNKGSGNVFLGNLSGSHFLNADNSNRLYIANSDTSIPLIYGHFPNNHIALNADSIKVRALVSGSGNAVYRNATTGLLVASSSDIRLKENIMPIEKGLDKVLQLQGVNYTWKSDDKHEKKIGLIAQEVEKVLPELVFTNEADGYKGINYAEITAVLIEAVKELKKEVNITVTESEENKKLIDTQNEKIGILINENKELKDEVSELKNLKSEIEMLKKHIKGYAVN
jgi:hypothetical protein